MSERSQVKSANPDEFREEEKLRTAFDPSLPPLFRETILQIRLQFVRAKIENWKLPSPSSSSQSSEMR